MELKREEMGDEDFEQWREMQAKLDRISAASRQKDQEPQAEGFTVTGDGRPVVDTTAADLEQGYNE